MKKRYILLVLLFVVITLLFWLHSKGPEESATQRPEAVETNQPVQPLQAQEHPTVAPPATAPSAVPNPPVQNNAALIENRLNEMKAETEKGL
jgi:hypothetical protein